MSEKMTGYGTARTYSVLRVSGQTFEEISKALDAAGYKEAFLTNGMIYMGGISLEVDPCMTTSERVLVPEPDLKEGDKVIYQYSTAPGVETQISSVIEKSYTLSGGIRAGRKELTKC